jgi:uncharacterized membrane protein
MPQTEVTPFWTIALTFFCSVLGALGQVFFKAGSSGFSLNPVQFLTNPRLLAGLGCYGLATFLFVFALKYGRLSVLYPVIALSYAWVFFASWLYFKEFQERSIALNTVGVALILAGVLLVASGR